MKKAFKANMTCHACEMLISDSVGELAGVKTVRADHKTGKVDVEFGAPATEQAVRKAIEKEGYEVSEAQ